MIDQLVIVSADGERHIIDSFDCNPLGYDALKSAFELGAKVPIPMRNVRLINEISGLVAEGLSFDLPWKPRLRNRSVGLVEGGWVPTTFGLNKDTLVILDRNFVSLLEGRVRSGTVRSGIKDDTVDDLTNYNPIYDPLLFAIEGNMRRLPDLATFKAQLEEARQKVLGALPLARVKEYPADLVAAIHNDLEVTFGTQSALERFLTEVSSIASKQIPRRNLKGTWEFVVETARNNRVAPKSLVVIAVLSAIATQGKSVARELFKFGQHYTPGHAYNAASDIRLMEAAALGLVQQGPFKARVVTSDKRLALLWCGLRVERTETNGFRLRPERALFPTDEAMELLQEMDSIFPSDGLVFAKA